MMALWHDGMMTCDMMEVASQTIGRMVYLIFEVCGFFWMHVEVVAVAML